MLMLESWQVVLRCCTRWLLVGGAFTYSALAPALGLGDITPHSALNQPFSADIALVDAAGLGEGDLSVSLVSADEFSRAGVERLFFLNNLKFTPILRGNRQMIRVTSSKPVTEPFLNFLVQLNQPNGRLLREYTVLIDPPGSPGIVPATDEPTARSDLSPFPAVEPATASSPNPQGKRDASAPAANAAPSATAAVNDEVAEQLAASVLQNQQLQKTIDDLNARLLARDAQIADGKKQVGELQTRLAELQQPPAAPVVVAPAPIVVEPQESSNWLLITGLLALALLALGWLFVRWRQQGLAPSEAPPVSASRHEPVLDQPPAPPGVVRSIPLQRDDSPAGDVLEGVGIYLAYGRFSEAAGLLREALTKEPQRTDLALQLLDVLGKQGDVSAYEAQENSLRVAGFDPQQIHDIRNRYPKMESAAPPVAAVPPVIVASAETPTSGADEFQLNLDELSMDSSWDLVSPTQETASTPKPVFTSSLHVLPEAYDEPDLEWLDDPQAPMLDDAFLDEFSEPNQPLAPEPHKPDNAGKLEQAQTCIDDGDLDSAIELLNQLLKEGDEPLKQTARNLLAGIR